MRLTLEPLVVLHALEIFEQLLDEKLYTFIPKDPPKTLVELEKRFLKLSTRFSPNKEEVWLNWILKSKETDKCVGTLESTIYNKGKASIAYIIFSEFWRKGYAY